MPSLIFSRVGACPPRAGAHVGLSYEFNLGTKPAQIVQEEHLQKLQNKVKTVVAIFCISDTKQTWQKLLSWVHIRLPNSVALSISIECCQLVAY